MGFVKDKMSNWSEQHPAEAEDRTRMRARTRVARRLVENVSGLFTDADLTRAAAVVIEQMEATQPVVVNGEQTVEEGKVVSTGQTVEFVPDNKARLEAAKFLTAMVEGTPVARVLSLSGSFTDYDAEQRSILLGLPGMNDSLAELEVIHEHEPGFLENENPST